MSVFNVCWELRLRKDFGIFSSAVVSLFPWPENAIVRLLGTTVTVVGAAYLQSIPRMIDTLLQAFRHRFLYAASNNAGAMWNGSVFLQGDWIVSGHVLNKLSI